MRGTVPAPLSSLIHRVHGQADSPPRRVQLGHTGQENLLTELSQVPDPRDARGVRHGLPTVLAMAIAAVLAGNTSFYAIGQWIAGAGQKTLRTLGARRDPVSGRYVGPDEKTVRRLCTRVDGDALDAALGRWLHRRAALASTAKARTGRRPPGTERPAAEPKRQVNAVGATAPAPSTSRSCPVWPWTARPPAEPGPTRTAHRIYWPPSPIPVSCSPSAKSPTRATKSPRSSHCCPRWTCPAW